MARIKTNAQYFSHDADMRNDLRIKALRRRFSHAGYATWNYLLEVLTDADNFEIDYDGLTQELLASDFEMSVDELREIIEYCRTLGLLQVTEDGERLYSAAHKRRLSSVTELREKRAKAGKAGMASRWGNSNNKSLQQGNKVITPDNNVITTDNEEKENKVEETKEEEMKEEKSNVQYPFSSILACWNVICGSTLPRVKTLNDDRRRKIKCRCQEWGGKSCEEWLAQAQELFERVIASDFLRGANKFGWTATFDWLFENSKNWVKVAEGNYDNGRSSIGAQQQRTQSGITLGAGEYIEPCSGRRTYGTGKVTIPPTAPARPSERHCWDASSQSWILL